MKHFEKTMICNGVVTPEVTFVKGIYDYLSSKNQAPTTRDIVLRDNKLSLKENYINTLVQALNDICKTGKVVYINDMVNYQPNEWKEKNLWLQLNDKSKEQIESIIEKGIIIDVDDTDIQMEKPPVYKTKEEHQFDYDLQRMKKLVEGEFVTVPDSIKTRDELRNWLYEQGIFSKLITSDVQEYLEQNNLNTFDDVEKHLKQQLNKFEQYCKQFNPNASIQSVNNMMVYYPNVNEKVGYVLNDMDFHSVQKLIETGSLGNIRTTDDVE